MKLSIITVCFNSEKTILDTLHSVQEQVYPDIEHIIVDGGSTDRTLEIIASNHNHLVTLISEPDQGIYDAMNKGLDMAAGDIIGILNSDDFYLNAQVLSTVVEQFTGNPNVDMILGNVDFVKPADLTKVARFYSILGFSTWQMRFGFMPAHPAAFIKKSAYEKVGIYKLGYQLAADFELFVRMLLIHKMKYVKLNKTLVRMRLGGVSTSGIKSHWVASKEILRGLKANGVYSNLIFVLARLPVKVFQLCKRKETADVRAN